MFHLCLSILFKYHIQTPYVLKCVVLHWFINITVLFLGNFLTKTDTKYTYSEGTHFYSFLYKKVYFISFPLAFRVCRRNFALLQGIEEYFLCRFCSCWFCLFGSKKKLEISSREESSIINI